MAHASYIQFLVHMLSDKSQLELSQLREEKGQASWIFFCEGMGYEYAQA